MNKKISIAIMCYNQENFIKDTIESCLNQTYKNIEICISDDCSTDKTYEIILDYKSKYPNIIKCFQQKENMGKHSLSINYNSALNLCTGEYIALLDGDDIMLAERIEKQVNFLEENEKYIGVSGWVEAFNSDTGELLGNIHNKLKVNNRTTETLIIYGNSIPPCLLFRNIRDKPRYNNNLKVMCDWLYYIELSMLGKIGHINEYLGKYRIHLNNSMKKDLSYDYFMTLNIVDDKYNFKYIKYTSIGKLDYFLPKAKLLIKEKKYYLGIKILLISFLKHPIICIKKFINLYFN